MIHQIPKGLEKNKVNAWQSKSVFYQGVLNADIARLWQSLSNTDRERIGNANI